MINLIPAGNITSGALDAERARMDIVANNLANAQSAGTANTVYQRRVAVFESVLNDEINNNGDATAQLGGVKLTEVSVDKSRQPIQEYMPYHPDADGDGMVYTPNISPMEEMVDMIAATRAYEANLNMLKESRKMADNTIGILKS